MGRAQRNPSRALQRGSAHDGFRCALPSYSYTLPGNQVMIRRNVLTAISLALMAAAAVAATGAQGQGTLAKEPPTLRFAVAGSSSQSELPYAIREAGLDKKYGINIEVIDVA